MRRLMLLRHAKSAWPDGVDDHERPLAKRGRTACALMGRYMVDEALLPDLTIVSTARRARESWELVRPAFGQDIVEARRACASTRPLQARSLTWSGKRDLTSIRSLSSDTIRACMSLPSSSSATKIPPICRDFSENTRQRGSSSSTSKSGAGARHRKALDSLNDSRRRSPSRPASPQSSKTPMPAVSLVGRRRACRRRHRGHGVAAQTWTLPCASSPSSSTVRNAAANRPA